MYVCLCLGVSDREIQAAIDAGACSVAEVSRCTGAGTRCGTCRSSLEAMVSRSASPEQVVAVGPSVRHAPDSSRRVLPLVPLPPLPSVA